MSRISCAVCSALLALAWSAVVDPPAAPLLLVVSAARVQEQRRQGGAGVRAKQKPDHWPTPSLRSSGSLHSSSPGKARSMQVVADGGEQQEDGGGGPTAAGLFLRRIGADGSSTPPPPPPPPEDSTHGHDHHASSSPDNSTSSSDRRRRLNAAIVAVLSTNPSVDTVALQDPSTPQGRALAWLESTDGRATEFLASTSLHWRLIQRYATATFFYSVDYDNQINDYDECDWRCVTCVGGVATVIDIQNRGKSGFIPPEVGALTGMVKLNLSLNDLTGSIPTEMGNLAALTALFLHANDLTGSIPTEMGNLAALTALYLYLNNLTGSIPTEMGNLAALKALFLMHDDLTGSIPTEMGNLAALKALYLYTNDLTGSIPTEMGNLAALKALDLNYNDLTGSIPTEMGNLAALTTLKLVDNDLTGSIPTEMGNLAALTSLSLHSNDITGLVPLSLCEIAGLGYISNDCDKTTCCCSACSCHQSSNYTLCEPDPFPDVTQFPAPCLNLPANRVHDGTPQQGWNLVPFPGEGEHSDDASVCMDLPFAWNHLGYTYNTVYIHMDGRLCGDGGSSNPRSCIYAFAGNVDTSNQYSFNANHVWFSSGPDAFAVVWDHVEGYYDTRQSRYNTFQILISNGYAETMGANSVCMCYDTMEWAGDDPDETVDVKLRDEESELYVLGSFSEDGVSYDGPSFGRDAVSFLDNKAICFDGASVASVTSMPPIAIDFPEELRTFELEACGFPDELTLVFYFVVNDVDSRSRGIYEVTYNDNVIPEGMLVNVQPINPAGTSYRVYVSWENISPVDPFEIEFVARDNGSPSLSTTKVVRVAVEDKCPRLPPPTPTPTTVPPISTLSPTTLPPVTPPPTTAVPSTAPPTDILQAVDVCDNDLVSAFSVLSALQKNCIWLFSHVDREVSDTAEFEGQIPSDVLASYGVDNLAGFGEMTWRDILCVAGHPARRTCPEICGLCEQRAIGAACGRDAFYATFEDEKGADRNCAWLRPRPRNHDKYCRQGNRPAALICPRTCQTCE